MKIVVNARIIRTSTGRYVDRLIYYLQQVDKTNEYVVILSEEDYDWWQPSSPNFSKVSFKFKRYSVLSQFKLAKLLYSLHADAVHFTFQPDVFTPFVALLYFKKKLMTIHDLTQLRFKNRKRNRLLFEILHYGFKILIRLNVWVMRAVITPTEFVKKDVKKYLLYPSNKLYVTEESADLANLNLDPTPLKDLEGSEFLLYVGTAHLHKNLPRLVDGFAILSLSRPNLKLVLAGKKERVFHDRLEKYIASSNVSGVSVIGFVEDNELAWLYKNCQAYVFPSLSEGFGLPGLEAMGYGAPVISSSATCLPEVYGEAAHYFDPNSPKDIARAIGEVLDNKKLRQKLIGSGYQQIKKYSWKKMAEQTLEVYELVVRKR